MNNKLIQQAAQILESSGDELKEVSFPRTAMHNVKSALEEIGYTMDYIDDNTNGWDVDFWYDFSKGTTELTVSGSVWNNTDDMFTLSKD